MSTRATYEFMDDYSSHCVYKHHDGYPEGALQWIARAIPHAWPLPRYEADEFAAAFVVGNKDCPGGVRLTAGPEMHSDTEYHYVITVMSGKLFVMIMDPSGEDLIDQDYLDKLLEKYAPKREWVK